MSDSETETTTTTENTTPAPAPESAEVIRVRMLTGEMAGSDWTTEQISAILSERNNDVYAAASDIWTYKAAALAASPVKFSADGGTYDYSEAYQHCLDEAAKCMAQSTTAGGMIIDPTLKPVGEAPAPDNNQAQPAPYGAGI